MKPVLLIASFAVMVLSSFAYAETNAEIHTEYSSSVMTPLPQVQTNNQALLLYENREIQAQSSSAYKSSKQFVNGRFRSSF